MELQYLLQEKYGDYNSPLIDVNYSRFINTLKQKSKMIKENSVGQFYKEKDIAMNGVISTRINYNGVIDINPLPLYLLGMDIDSVDEKNQATLELSSMGIKHVSMVSSIHPLHFWIIADFIGSIEECISLMDKIPGIDKNYIYMCNKRNSIVFRAFPKINNSSLPTFPFLDKSCSTIFSDWYLEFWNYWTNQDMVEICKNILSNKQVSEKNNDIIIVSDNNIEGKMDFSNLDL